MTRVRDRALVIAASVVLSVVVPPPESFAAGLPAPVLVSPVGGIQSDVTVTFAWQRVTGAAGYRLRVRHATADGPVHVDIETVNDTHVALVNFSGDPAHWEVAALSATGEPGDWSTASFTTAALAPTPRWPPDGATVNHPDAWPMPLFDTVPGQPEGMVAALGATGDPPPSQPTEFGLGTWRWQVRSTRPPGDPISPSPSSEVQTFTYAWPGGTPALLSPPDGHVLGVTDALRLRWATVPGAAMYHWELTRDGQIIQSATGTRATWADIFTTGAPDELPPGTYQWRVRAVLSGTIPSPANGVTQQFGPWSAPRSVTIPGAPATPVQTSPDDGAAVAAWPVLRWDRVAGATSYAVQVADAPNPATAPVVHGSSVNAFSFWSDGDVANPEPMYQATPGTVTRYWRVRAHGTVYGGGPGQWSPWRSFTVTPVGSPLVVEAEAVRLGPVDCADDGCPDLDGVPLLRWQPVPGAASYRVLIRWDGTQGPADAWYDTGSDGLPLAGYRPATGTSRVAWSVLACPATGCASSMPVDRSQFRVTFPAPVQTGAPTGTIQVESAVEMSWLEPAAPIQPDTLSRAFETEIEVVVTPGEFGPTDLWRTFLRQPQFSWFGVRSGAEVAWRVRASAYDAPSRVGGQWSPWRTITREEPAISLVSPAAGAILDSTPVLDWSALPYAVDGYQWELVKLSTLEALVAQHPQNEELYADLREMIGATSARLPELAPGDYRWRVRRIGAGGPNQEHDGAWTTRTFTITGPDLPQQSSPAAGATVMANDLVMTWSAFAITAASETVCDASAGPNADNQVAEVATSPSFVAGAIVYRGCAGRWATVHPLPELLPVGDLYWRVCAAFDCTPGRLLHVTAAPQPDATPPASSSIRIVPTLHKALTIANTIPVTITWSAFDVGTGIASQSLQIRRGSGAWIPIAVPPAARSATTFMDRGATYAVRTRAVDFAGNVGAWTTRTLETALRQESSSRWSWSASWRRAYRTSASGGATRWSPYAGAIATTKATGFAMGLVAPRSSTRGNARIYVDGVYVGTVKFHAAPTGPRRIVWKISWATAGTHRITIRVNGTAGHPRVDIDALVILR